MRVLTALYYVCCRALLLFDTTPPPEALALSQAATSHGGNAPGGGMDSFVCSFSPSFLTAGMSGAPTLKRSRFSTNSPDALCTANAYRTPMSLSNWK